VLGIAASRANGQAEFLAALSGETPIADAQAILASRRTGRPARSAQRARSGWSNVPEERLGRGAVPGMSLAQNSLLTGYGHGMVRRGLVDARAATGDAERSIRVLRRPLQGSGLRRAELSGGNLQKFIVGRRNRQSPKVMIVAQPTWGVDVAASAPHPPADHRPCRPGRRHPGGVRRPRRDPGGLRPGRRDGGRPPVARAQRFRDQRGRDRALDGGGFPGEAQDGREATA